VLRLRSKLAGELDHFTGVSDPYEAPEAPDVIVDSGTQTVEESVAAVLAAVQASGLLPEPALRG